MGWMLGVSLQMFYFLSQTLIVSVYTVKWIVCVIPFIFVFSLLIVRSVQSSIKETVRLFNTTKSPLLSYLGETISGASTIRAFGRSEEFIVGNN